MECATVVTGASSGIGEAIARHLLDSGCTLIALRRRAPRLKHQRLLFHAVDLADAVIDGIPVKWVGTPDDIAHAVRFLLSTESGYITGQTLFVCGGTSVSGTGGE